METVVTIKKTQEAIKYYQMAIENAEIVLESTINKDKTYNRFKNLLYKHRGVNVLYLSHSREFSAYNIKSAEIVTYFTIIDEKIIYDENNTFDNIEDTANKLLNIVKKFF